MPFGNFKEQRVPEGQPFAKALNYRKALGRNVRFMGAMRENVFRRDLSMNREVRLRCSPACEQ